MVVYVTCTFLTATRFEYFTIISEEARMRQNPAMLAQASVALKNDIKGLNDYATSLFRERRHSQLGRWGGMKPWARPSNPNMKVCGANMRFENPVDGDDTAANGLQIRYCDTTNGVWGRQETKTVYNGNWGSWKGMKMCPRNS